MIAAMPSNHIETRMILFVFKHIPHELTVNGLFGLIVLIEGFRNFEISQISKSIGSNGTQFWKTPVSFKDFGNPASARSFDFNGEFNSSWNDSNFSFIHRQFSKLGYYIEFALLRHNQKISVLVLDGTVFHGF